MGDMTSKFFSRLGVRRTGLLALLLPAVGITALTGCSAYNNVTQRIAQHITPYRVTIVQGNFVSQEAAAKLQVGMSQDQVRAALGTPLLTDMFHKNRWDYIFYFKRGSTEVVQQRDLVLMFADDRLASWSGGEDLPSEFELISEIDGDKHAMSRGAQEKQAAAAAAAASAASAAAAASAPSAAAPASNAVPANAAAAQAANAATSKPLPSVAPSSGAPVPSAPLQGVTGTGITGQSQFHLRAPGGQSGNGNFSTPGLQGGAPSTQSQ